MDWCETNTLVIQFLASAAKEMREQVNENGESKQDGEGTSQSYLELPIKPHSVVTPSDSTLLDHPQHLVSDSIE